MSKFITSPVVSFDIETDTDAPRFDPEISSGLDPRAGSIISAALSGSEGALVLDDANERRLLQVLLEYASQLPKDTLITTWNGAVFDLPFLYYRCEQVLGIKDHGLELTFNEQIPVKYNPLPTFKGGYDVLWYGKKTLDISSYFKPFATKYGLSLGLKPILAALGHSPVSEDAANASTLTQAARMAYNLSDVEVTTTATQHLELVDSQVVVVENPEVQIVQHIDGSHTVTKNGTFHANIVGRKVFY